MRSAVDVDAVLDSGRMRGVPLIATTCALVILVLDGFDIQVMGVAAPVVIMEFGIAPRDLGPVLAASLIGMALGSFIIGPAGDRWGRRPALLGSATLFGLATLLAATASSIGMLATWRFVTGLGLGGALPNATALIAEFVPSRWRSVAITAAIAGTPVGGMLGAALAAEIIPVLGWRSIFLIGGILPLITLVPIYFLLPESARFLAPHGVRRSQLVALLNRIEGRARFSGDDTFTCRIPHRQDAGLWPLFSRALVRDTLAAWVVFAASMFAVYAFANWIPAVFASVGFDVATAVRGALVFNLAGAFGALANAWVMKRLGSRLPLVALAVLAIGALLFLAQALAGDEVPQSAGGMGGTVLIGIGLAGFGITALQLGMYAVAAHLYPTECRSSGVGWALGVGRLGGILSSLVGGMLLATGGTCGFFFGVAAVVVVALIGTLALSRHVPPAVAGGSPPGRGVLLPGEQQRLSQDSRIV